MRAIHSATRFTFLIALAFGLVACAATRPAPELRFADAASVGMSDEKLREIRPALQPFLDSGRLPGFALLVARDGAIVAYDAFGHRDVEAGLPMEIDTIFRMYSMTKPVTAVAVMQLVDEGAVSLDDPVSKFIPEFADMRVISKRDDGSTDLVPASVTMTVRHLMTHTSGLSYGFLNPSIYPYYEEAGINDFTKLTLEEFARAAASAPLLHEPGAGWNYSIGMDILGRIVEVVSGMRYEDYLEANLFRPLGMDDSGFYVPADKLHRFAAVYAPNEEKTAMLPMEDVRLSDFLTPPSMASGGGGMVGTIGDYYRFAQMLLGGGELDGVRVLSEASAREILSDQLGPDLGPAPLATLTSLALRAADDAATGQAPAERGGLAAMAFNNLGFGLCGSVVRPGAMPIFGSAGSYWWGGLASTEFWIDPAENLVAILCTQLIPSGTYPTRMIFSNAVYKSIEDRRAESR
jgi:CubicO group peptidase (beta-lactamase class C family)